MTSTEFLRGAATTDECDPLFKQYEKCLSVGKVKSRRETILIHLQKVLKDRGIDKMVMEAREDNRENDAEHMRPVSYCSSIWAVSLLTSSETINAYAQGMTGVHGV